MTTIFIAILLFVFGAMLGSFAGAQVWRLRARQLMEDKAAGENVDRRELRRLKPLLAHKGLQDRSIDLDTGTRLKWYDMIPVISWLMLRGRSRYSGKPIGRMEFFLELGGGALCVAWFLLWPFELTSIVDMTRFVIGLGSIACLLILFAYDARWYLLPDPVMYIFIALAGVYAALGAIMSPDSVGYIASLTGAVVILSGLYFILYTYSRIRYGDDKIWIGFGDIKLGLGLALLVGTWQHAFIALFGANLIGTVLVGIALLLGKVHMKDRIPFGPLLIVGTFCAIFWGNTILNWFTTLSF